MYFRCVLILDMIGNYNIKSLSKLWYFLATGCGIGTISNNCIPVGTVSSLVAVPIWWGILYFFSYRTYLIFLIFIIIIGIYCCNKTAKIIGVHDHRSIVLDEFIGMWVTLIIIPTYSILWILCAILLFRIMDIIKPWPISWVDKTVQGGFGIVIDDVLAASLAVCVLVFMMKIFYY